jgi:hypothetical protein
MREINRALADILEIRCRIAAGTAFQGYGPTTVALTGVIGLTTALIQSVWPSIFAASTQAYIVCWLITAGICAIAIFIEMQGRSQRLHSHLAGSLINQALEQLLPAAAASAFVPIFLLRFAPQSLWMMPGLWQLFVSLGIFASIRNLPRRMALGAAWYFISGFASLLMSAGNPHTLSPWLMGLPFFAGQLLMAMLLFTTAEASDE